MSCSDSLRTNSSAWYEVQLQATNTKHSGVSQNISLHLVKNSTFFGCLLIFSELTNPCDIRNVFHILFSYSVRRLFPKMALTIFSGGIWKNCKASTVYHLPPSYVRISVWIFVFPHPGFLLSFSLSVLFCFYSLYAFAICLSLSGVSCSVLFILISIPCLSVFLPYVFCTFTFCVPVSQAFIAVSFSFSSKGMLQDPQYVK